MTKKNHFHLRLYGWMFREICQVKLGWIDKDIYNGWRGLKGHTFGHKLSQSCWEKICTSDGANKGFISKHIQASHRAQQRQQQQKQSNRKKSRRRQGQMVNTHTWAHRWAHINMLRPCTLLDRGKSKLQWGINSQWWKRPSSKRREMTNAREGVEKREPSYTVGGREMGAATIEKSMEGP